VSEQPMVLNSTATLLCWEHTEHERKEMNA
jgi:hypothetical protein